MISRTENAKKKAHEKRDSPAIIASTEIFKKSLGVCKGCRIVAHALEEPVGGAKPYAALTVVSKTVSLT